MTIENFFTSKLQAAAGKSAQAQGSGVQSLTASQNINFFDFMLARTLKDDAALTQSIGSKAKEDKQVFSTQNTLLQSSNPALSKDAGLRASDLLAVNTEIAKEVQEFSSDLQDEISQTLALNKKAFDDLLSPVESADVLAVKKADLAKKKMLTLAESLQLDPANNAPMMSRLKSLLAKLENITGEQMQLANLDPALVESLKAKISALLTKQPPAPTAKDLYDPAAALPAPVPLNPDDLRTAEGIALGLVQIVPALKKMQVALQAQTPAAQPFAQPEQQAASNGVMAEIASRLNKMTPGAEPDAPVMPADFAAEVESFDHILKDIGTLKNVRDGAPVVANGKSQAAAPQGSAAVPNILGAWPFAGSESLLGSLNWDKSMFEHYAGITAQTSTPITGTVSMTSLVGHAPAAIYPHPAVKILAKTINTMAASGQEKAITLQMDPPELGRVKVNMIFGKDKTVKATVVAEKPETLAMLQRDAHVLERALEDAGIDSAGSSLDFQMAGGDQGFSNNGKHDGYESGGRGKNAPESEPEILETTMTWHVDPHTGYTRYDILV